MTDIVYRPFSQIEEQTKAHLRHRLVGFNGMNSTGCILNHIGAVTYNSGIYTNGPGGNIPAWVYNDLLIDARRKGDAELKVLYDLEAEIQRMLHHNIPLAGSSVYIRTNFGPCQGCRKAIMDFSNYYRNMGLNRVSVLYITESINLFGGINGYGAVDRNPDGTYIKCI